jgi:hypothetical protein
MGPPHPHVLLEARTHKEGRLHHSQTGFQDAWRFKTCMHALSFAAGCGNLDAVKLILEAVPEVRGAQEGSGGACACWGNRGAGVTCWR